MLVQREREAAAPDGPGCTRIVSRLQRILINLLGLVDALRLRGAALIERDGQYHEEPHLEEFGFPVLRGRFDECTRRQILSEAEGWLAVLVLLVVVVRASG